ncbi:acyl-CoA dehydratase activase [Desulforamulus hydrothermalis]|uniref:ATPase, activator of (R)-hydroxyglutaryl-CoA dehydratase n=1 Tax=Desulforamulus hydrothermalis Lam5 = DSM 18033 TaxID=1121428 RepID=K8ELM1_9FIRM|nr:acyl-CoA dehydratase activase [Desulforamulus hydrothermalis]CCO09366.1 ATPase, activator of (R)-hydroxyglutaryl-CoA dehydratase [Desulforamulus hydrothermalis Lam5 = DSM 18033]SHH32053.1 CoA-substrate-specific enzyme activase, putative [Desulforamulus hydrothermalis Lam5 = DSM 18033]
MKAYLGIDVGSVSTNIVIVTEDNNVLASLYLRTRGRPIEALQAGLKEVAASIPAHLQIAGVGATGSGRFLAGVMVGADVVKNEITAHAVAASLVQPNVQTVLEIGGQDSKIIILRNGVVTDFAMNTVCAAGTGSFLDQQAARLGIPIQEFGQLALKSASSVRIAGRCTVFAESDMIHKQQMGHRVEDIINGLCEALVRNYLNNVGKGKEILPPILFQGGVAANQGIKAAFERALGHDVQIPKYYNVMGALGAAQLAKEELNRRGGKTKFKGFDVTNLSYLTRSFECNSCSNLCEIVEVLENDAVIGRWGSRCGKWDIADL